jgi:LysM repeat protein
MALSQAQLDAIAKELEKITGKVQDVTKATEDYVKETTGKEVNLSSENIGKKESGQQWWNYFDANGKQQAYYGTKQKADTYAASHKLLTTSPKTGEVSSTANVTTHEYDKAAGYTGTSLVDFLKMAGVDSNSAARIELAKKLGITNYKGTSAQNTQILNSLKAEAKGSTSAAKLSSTDLKSYLKSAGLGYSNSEITALKAKYGLADSGWSTEQENAAIKAAIDQEKASTAEKKKAGTLIGTGAKEYEAYKADGTAITVMASSASDYIKQAESNGLLTKKPTASEIAASKAKSTTTTSGSSYTIQSGDTLSAIAKKYGTTVDALAKANGIADVNKIKAGAKITVPSSSTTPATTTPTKTTPATPTPTPTPTPTSTAGSLYEYYTKQGKSLPSLSARADLYSKYNLGSASSYAGTEKQNAALLKAIQGSGGTTTPTATKTITGYVGYVKGNAMSFGTEAQAKAAGATNITPTYKGGTTPAATVPVSTAPVQTVSTLPLSESPALKTGVVDTTPYGAGSTTPTYVEEEPLSLPTWEEVTPTTTPQLNEAPALKQEYQIPSTQPYQTGSAAVQPVTPTPVPTPTPQLNEAPALKPEYKVPETPYNPAVPETPAPPTLPEEPEPYVPPAPPIIETPEEVVVTSEPPRQEEEDIEEGEQEMGNTDIIAQQDEISRLQNQSLIQQLRQSLGIEEPTVSEKPALPSLEDQYQELLQTNGITATQTKLAGLDKTIADMEASLTQGMYDEEGQLRPMELIGTRQQELNRQGQEKLDSLTREKAVYQTELSNKMGIVENLMKYKGADYENATQEYTTSFNQALQYAQLLSGMASQEATIENQAKDNARANLTVVTNMLKDSNTTIANASTSIKNQIKQLELQAGIPVGSTEAFSNSTPNVEILSAIQGTDAEGNDIVTYIYKDQKTGMAGTKQVISTGGKTTEKASATEKATASEQTEINRVQSQLEASRNGGENVDGNVYLSLRASSTLSPTEFDQRFGDLLSLSDQKKYGLVSTTQTERQNEAQESTQYITPENVNTWFSSSDWDKYAKKNGYSSWLGLSAKVDDFKAYVLSAVVAYRKDGYSDSEIETMIKPMIQGGSFKPE